MGEREKIYLDVKRGADGAEELTERVLALSKLPGYQGIVRPVDSGCTLRTPRGAFYTRKDIADELWRIEGSS